MRIAEGPIGDQHIANIGLAVPVGVFQVQRFDSILNDRAATMKRNCRGDTQVLSKHG